MDSMHRGIFRAKHKKTGAWIEGAYHRHLSRTPGCLNDSIKPSEITHFIIRDEFSDWNMPRGIEMLEIDPQTLGECTCVPDKNGKLIFEGDIVKMKSYRGGYHFTTVYFADGKFAVDGSHYHRKDIHSRSVEVIGNIHDDPAMLASDDEQE